MDSLSGKFNSKPTRSTPPAAYGVRPHIAPRSGVGRSARRGPWERKQPVSGAAQGIWCGPKIGQGGERSEGLAQDLSIFNPKTGGSAAQFFGALFFETFPFQNAPVGLQVD